MAVKKDATKRYDYDAELVMKALTEPRFAQMIDAAFVEEAKTSEGIEFRYVRKTTAIRYGRNFFVKVNPAEDGKTDVTVVVQSRKVIVLLDTSWKPEANRVFTSLDVLTELLASK